jgi:hypothetical protein
MWHASWTETVDGRAAGVSLAQMDIPLARKPSLRLFVPPLIDRWAG